MDGFQEALEQALVTLTRLQQESEHPPRASRNALACLQELPGLVRQSKAERLAPLRERVAVCTRCAHLASFRTQTVFGVGNCDAELMFIGEAPGADEDRQGEPFVGRAGQLLTKIIAAMGFTRDEVYIANVLKCRPDMPPGVSGNRPPTPDEMATCLPYLTEQIEIIAPKVLVALGATAVEGLLGRRETMSRMRGTLAHLRRNPAHDHVSSVVSAAKPKQHRETQSLGRHAARAGKTGAAHQRKAA